MHFKTKYWPLLTVIIMIILLAYGLFQDPRILPSVLISKTAPDFEAADLFEPQKIVHSQSELRGHYTIVNVWASWCLPCRTEHAFLLKLKKAHPKLHWLGINYKDDPMMAQSFLAALENPYDRVILDLKGSIGLNWGVYGTPETFLVDPNGAILHRHAGILTDHIWQNEFMEKIKNYA